MSFETFRLWTLLETIVRHSPKFLIPEKLDTSLDKQLPSQTEYQVGKSVISDSAAEAASTREMRKGDDIFLTVYEYICTKILCCISFGFQYIYQLNLQSPFKNVNSFNEPTHITTEGSKFWAVLIGIDAYEFCPLRGCVADALLVERYLKEDIGVPQERIQLLLGSPTTGSSKSSFPSRANIVNTLLSLIDNPQIKNGDNIIIYFSGHGSGYSSSEYYLGGANSAEDSESLGAVDERIEAICPIDRDVIDSSGLRVPDISDREINAILQQISKTKGHRITFILDSCHSGTHTRHFPEPGTRTVPPLPRASLRRMLHLSEENLARYPSYQSILTTDWCPDMTSHVIFAACKEYQTVKEVESDTGTGYNGIFTQALIDTLRSGNLSDESTYVDLLFSLPRIGGQTPIVAGKHKYDRIWYKD